MNSTFISYEDKVTLNERPEVAEINKVTADNMNEVKDVVNNHANNIGDLSNLNTENKDSVVDSINEVISDLKTPKLLYTSNSFAKSITLSESVENYDYIIIETKANQYVDYIKMNQLLVYKPNGKQISCSNSFYGFEVKRGYFVQTFFLIQDNKITISANQAGSVGADSSYAGNADCLMISNVYGIKL